MNEKELEVKIGEQIVAIQKMEEQINWLMKRIENRRQRIRDLGRQRSDALNLKLDLR